MTVRQVTNSKQAVKVRLHNLYNQEASMLIDCGRNPSDKVPLG